MRFLPVLALTSSLACSTPSLPSPTTAQPDASSNAKTEAQSSPVEAFATAACEGRLQEAHDLLDTEEGRDGFETKWNGLIDAFGPCSGLAAVDSSHDGTVTRLFFTFGGVLVPLRALRTEEGRLTSLRWMDWRPNPKADLSGFHEEALALPGEAWPLSATVTLPEDPRAWVVLVHGSGPHDRDERLGPNRPFRDIAWGLAAHGIATLRYDKRTFVHPAALAEVEASVGVREVVVEDAVRAATAAHELAGGAPVYLAGHSLGGHVLPWIASEVPSCAGVVLLAANISPLASLIPVQAEYLANLDGELSVAERAQLALVRNMSTRIAALDGSTPGSTMGAPNRFWADLNGNNPADGLKGAGKRALLMFGERDYQVPLSEAGKWKKALGETPATFVQIPGVNHMFMLGEGTPGPDEYKRLGHVDAAAIDAIATFVLDES
ncbi:MAG: alpha/beta hydrolase family protein [Nannocystales bacterium]